MISRKRLSSVSRSRPSTLTPRWRSRYQSGKQRQFARQQGLVVGRQHAGLARPPAKRPARPRRAGTGPGWHGALPASTTSIMVRVPRSSSSMKPSGFVPFQHPRHVQAGLGHQSGDLARRARSLPCSGGASMMMKLSPPTRQCRAWGAHPCAGSGGSWRRPRPAAALPGSSRCAGAMPSSQRWKAAWRWGSSQLTRAAGEGEGLQGSLMDNPFYKSNPAGPRCLSPREPTALEIRLEIQGVPRPLCPDPVALVVVHSRCMPARRRGAGAAAAGAQAQHIAARGHPGTDARPAAHLPVGRPGLRAAPTWKP